MKNSWGNLVTIILGILVLVATLIMRETTVFITVIWIFIAIGWCLIAWDYENQLRTLVKRRKR